MNYKNYLPDLPYRSGIKYIRTYVGSNIAATYNYHAFLQLGELVCLKLHIYPINKLKLKESIQYMITLVSQLFIFNVCACA